MYSRLLRCAYRLWPTRTRLTVPPSLWQELIEELGRRGLAGRREAGAFLLGHRQERDRRVVKAVYFDDLDPGCLVGHIHLQGPGFSKLWDICEAEGLHVLADVHTHPSKRVTQSSIDRENPMIATTGHLALIVPEYGTRPVVACEVGVHEYRGNRGWRSWLGLRAERVLRMGSK